MSSEICNFADDNTIYACGNDIQEIVMVLEDDFCKLLEWFTCYGMVVNTNKSQLMFLGLKRKQKLRINISGVKILAKKHVKLLGVEIDNKRKFDRRVEALRQKVDQRFYETECVYFQRTSTINL